RGRPPPAGRSGRKARSRWGRRSYRGGAAGWFGHRSEYCRSPRPGGEYCRQLGVAGRFNRAGATLLQGVGPAGWFGYHTEYCGSPRPGGEYRRQLGVAVRLDRAEGDAPADTPGLLYLPRRLSYRPENSISISEIRPWLLPLMIFS